MVGPLVAGRGWNKPSGGWSGEYRRSGCGMYWRGVNKVKYFLGGVHRIEQRMYRERGKRDGGGKGIAGVLIWVLK